jgi:hypothetical protein
MPSDMLRESEHRAYHANARILQQDADCTVDRSGRPPRIVRPEHERLEGQVI